MLTDLQPRHPPHNFEAEQALLGAILMNNRAIERVSEFLRPEHFADPVHGRIYDACVGLTARNQIATPVTLKTFLANDAGLKDMGGDGYLVRLAGAAATIINAHDYGRLIFDLHLRRSLIAVGEDMVNDAFDAEIDRDAVIQIEAAEQRLAALAEARTADAGARSCSDAMAAMLAEAEAARHRGRTGLATGLVDLDEKLGGLVAGNLLILAGRPGMGKSAIAPCIARTVAAVGVGVAYFTLEMMAEEICQRLAADAAGVPYEAIRRGTVDSDDWGRLAEVSNALSALPLYIDDTAGLRVEQIRARARRLRRRHQIGLVVIDHIGLIRMGENRLQGLTHISASLKEMAKELQLPVIALCQLNRAVEGRDDKRPHLADLRESGSIEQDADIVMLLHRQCYYTEREEPQQKAGETREKFADRLADWHDKLSRERHRADVLVAKNRQGRTGTVSLYCELALSRFRSLASSIEESR